MKRAEQSIEQQAQEAAEKKLRNIIARYGDAGGERRKPYYLAQLIEEAKTAISWTLISLALMDLDNENAPTPTKVPGA